MYVWYLIEAVGKFDLFCILRSQSAATEKLFLMILKEF